MNLKISSYFRLLLLSLPLTFFSQPSFAATGQELFKTECSFCHGDQASNGLVCRDIVSASAGKIKNGINNRPEMQYLQGRFTDADINAIADYLATVPRGQTGSFCQPSTWDPVKGEALFRESCVACHVLGSVTPRAPDLFVSRQRYNGMEWHAAFIAHAPEFIAKGAHTTAGFGYTMPDLNHTDTEVYDIAKFVFDATAPLVPTAPKTLTSAEFESTKQVYFDRCAGCHGLYRTGATGPNIGEVRAKQLGTDALKAIIKYGTPRGMPQFGSNIPNHAGGVLTLAEIENLSAYLQLPPPPAPSMSMTDIQNSWQLYIPVSARPTAPMHNRNWKNFVGIIERDASRVSIIDGDTKTTVAQLSVGFAVHILRTSSTGRYFYAVGRDGLVTMIDLWSAQPTVVAQVKGCHDARSVDGSKFTGYEEKYLIEGCYWPPQYVVFDGLTLQPLARNDIPMTDIAGVTLPEVRVASIVASHTDPLWVISMKESGYVGLVDYSQPGFPLVANIPTAKFLHDGGFDHTGQYFLVAANASNKMVVVDVTNKKGVTTFYTGLRPHPGRGANWLDPVYGWVNATTHIAEGKMSVYGADPVNHPENAWKVVREVLLPSSGSLFLKTHDASPWVLMDMTLSTDPALAKSLCAYKKSTGLLDHCFQLSNVNGVATHMEFSQDGSEVWISDWSKTGQVIILDSTTLVEKTRLGGLITPTGKFGVNNTAHDIY